MLRGIGKYAFSDKNLKVGVSKYGHVIYGSIVLTSWKVVGYGRQILYFLFLKRYYFIYQQRYVG
jgi:hypothetical protein